MFRRRLSRTVQKGMKHAKVKNVNEEETAQRTLYQDTFLNSASGDRCVHCMLHLKWARGECARIDLK
jgi:hypothetical protein